MPIFRSRTIKNQVISIHGRPYQVDANGMVEVRQDEDVAKLRRMQNVWFEGTQLPPTEAERFVAAFIKDKDLRFTLRGLEDPQARQQAMTAAGFTCSAADAEAAFRKWAKTHVSQAEALQEEFAQQRFAPPDPGLFTPPAAPPPPPAVEDPPAVEPEPDLEKAEESAPAPKTEWSIPKEGEGWPEPTEDMPLVYLQAMAAAYDVKYGAKDKPAALVKKIIKAAHK